MTFNNESYQTTEKGHRRERGAILLEYSTVISLVLAVVYVSARTGGEEIARGYEDIENTYSCGANILSESEYQNNCVLSSSSSTPYSATFVPDSVDGEYAPDSESGKEDGEDPHDPSGYSFTPYQVGNSGFMGLNSVGAVPFFEGEELVVPNSGNKSLVF